MNNKELLPLGSVVLLKNATHRLMVIGYAAIRYGENGKSSLVYDYWGCPYPEGQFESDQHMIFNHKDIKDIIAEGYSDDSEKKFRKRVENVLKQIRNDKNELIVNAAQLANIAGKESR